jgi:hypothetical protein
MDQSARRKMSFSQAFAETRVLSLVMPTTCVGLGVAGWIVRAKFGASSTELVILLGIAFVILLISLLFAVRRHQLGENPLLRITPSGDVDIRATRHEILSSIPLTVAGIVSMYFFIVGSPTHVLAALAAGIVLWQVLRRLLR